MATWGILTHLLYSKGIRSLGVEIGGIFKFLAAASKPAKATGGARQRFIGLGARGVRGMVSSGISSSPSSGVAGPGGGQDKLTFCKRTRGS